MRACDYRGRVAVLAHGLTKESAVPEVDIEPVLRRKQQFEADPDGFTYEE